MSALATEVAGPLNVGGDDKVEALVAMLEAGHGARIVTSKRLPASAGRYAELPRELAPKLKLALERKGISQLYTHQSEAWATIREAMNTVVVTPTASGKTLCYNLPILQSIVSSEAKALYLFPTKALSQDQVAELLEINRAGDLGVRAYTFDGDTPGDARKAVRTRGDIVVSNPDMIHQGVLPHHTKWAQFFESLRYVVIDEMHTYRGVFGSHMANVIRRLRRVCRFYGSDPVFVLCSATIANPAELAERLIGEPVTTIDHSGAPRGERHLLLWNPPVVNPDLGIRASARSQTARIARMAVATGLKTIVFAQTRLMVEVLTKYMKEAFDKDPRHPAKVKAYRGGYLPTERRTIESQLRAGEIDCVISTVALELGVDIGALDVAILCGYPGTVAGTWQRLGRAGRRNRPSLAVVVANSSPLDQFIAKHPEFFTEASPEHARIDPDQLLILMDHIRCAAFELPFRDGEGFGGEAIAECLQYLADEQVLHHEGDRWHWMSDDYPANGVSLRSVAEGNFLVIDTTDGQRNIIAEADYSAAALTLYEGAIYMIQARPWQVELLDWEGRKAYVRSTNADYYTDAIDYTKLKILESFEQDADNSARCTQGEVHLVRRVAGYKKIRFQTHENIGFGNVNLPDQEMHTTALWWQLEPEIIQQSFADKQAALDGFLGAAHAMHFIATLITMSEPRDIGRSVGTGDAGWCAPGSSVPVPPPEQQDPVEQSDTFIPTVYLYDNYPGGIGLTAPLFDARDEVVRRSLELVTECECVSGCPACIGPVVGETEGTDSPKIRALKVLWLLHQKGH
ncbi:MAG: helicase [Thiotrichales bacterium]|nr:helicase [Thiotrichales bacterium]